MGAIGIAVLGSYYDGAFGERDGRSEIVASFGITRGEFGGLSSRAGVEQVHSAAPVQIEAVRPNDGRVSENRHR